MHSPRLTNETPGAQTPGGGGCPGLWSLRPPSSGIWEICSHSLGALRVSQQAHCPFQHRNSSWPLNWGLGQHRATGGAHRLGGCLHHWSPPRNQEKPLVFSDHPWTNNRAAAPLTINSVLGEQSLSDKQGDKVTFPKSHGAEFMGQGGEVGGEGSTNSRPRLQRNSSLDRVSSERWVPKWKPDTQNFTEKPHFRENPQKGLVTLLSLAVLCGVPPPGPVPTHRGPARLWAPGTMTSQYEGTKGGLIDILGTLRSTMEWINQERVGGSDEWGVAGIGRVLSCDRMIDAPSFTQQTTWMQHDQEGSAADWGARGSLARGSGYLDRHFLSQGSIRVLGQGSPWGTKGTEGLVLPRAGGPIPQAL